MIRLDLILTNDWLEATWVDEITIINEVDGEQKESKETVQLHCESYSGHPEHITMLRAKALEFGTELDEALIGECVANFKYPTEEELAQQELEAKIAEAKTYLASTDFKMTVDYYAALTPEQQEELMAKRAEARAFLREQGL